MNKVRKETKEQDSSISIEYEKDKGIFLRFYNENFFSNEINTTIYLRIM